MLTIWAKFPLFHEFSSNQKICYILLTITSRKLKKCVHILLFTRVRILISVWRKSKYSLSNVLFCRIFDLWHRFKMFCTKEISRMRHFISTCTENIQVYMLYVHGYFLVHITEEFMFYETREYFQISSFDLWLDFRHRAYTLPNSSNAYHKILQFFTDM